ncbi:uncharacterized protein LOC106650313 [Trichogramma pretiosum]|uniref:uncharacterized protein LOC106650313 n=1 Tax=Trichogramma pretiosum TaxID=7493 RepID=UPI0006C9CFA6|nr:uncharacterized protein LOC106650313 [Trichogramma pretiosum]
MTDVPSAMRSLKKSDPNSLQALYRYFDETYVSGKPRASPPRYPIKLWNQFVATQKGTHRTNNISEGWHNRFCLMIGKNHPDLYSLLLGIRDEQADTESMVVELSIAKAVKNAPKTKWVQHQQRLRSVTNDYPRYKREKNIVQYLSDISSNIKLS